MENEKTADEKTAQLGITMGIIIAVLLVVIFFGVYYYLPKLDQRVNTLSARLDATSSTTNGAEAKTTDLTPRVAELEKNYNVLVNVINTKMPNVNLPALLAIANTKGTPSANIALAITLIENEPQQAKNYLAQALAFNDNEINAVMGPMDKYNKKSKLFGKMKFFHAS